MTTGSGTVEKALALLPFFTEQSPTLGLSRLARLSGINKATTLRYLLALQSAGFIEQDAETSAYYLGPAFSKYARIRMAANPFQRVVDRVSASLASLTNETAHVSRLGHEELETVALVEGTRSARVILAQGERLPLHATASGLSLLGWATNEVLDAVLASELEVFTEHTISTTEQLLAVVQEVRTKGFSYGNQGFELDVVGIAAPYFDESGFAVGAVAVAFPVSRSTPDLERRVAIAVTAAGRELTTALGGVEPPTFPKARSDTEPSRASEVVTITS
ncbi:MAG: IclR family transcriptional regulator [Pseudomonadota bacterium]